MSMGSFLRNLHLSPGLRWLIIPLLRLVGNRDLTIEHHWVRGQRIRLHAFRHKGYWYHGRNRERSVMANYGSLIHRGDTVFELGGHIGYVTCRLADLVGPKGKVYVFEPSPSNLPYLQANVGSLPQVEIIEAAASNKDGSAPFFVEGLTGQNDTLIEDYSVYEQNRRLAYVRDEYQQVSAPTVKLDTFISQRGIKPDFIKIDVEGAELEALQGARDCLTTIRPALMVEVTHRASKVMRLMDDVGYECSNEDLGPWQERLDANRFFLPATHWKGDQSPVRTEEGMRRQLVHS